MNLKSILALNETQKSILEYEKKLQLMRFQDGLSERMRSLREMVLSCCADCESSLDEIISLHLFRFSKGKNKNWKEFRKVNLQYLQQLEFFKKTISAHSTNAIDESLYKKYLSLRRLRNLLVYPDTERVERLDDDEYYLQCLRDMVEVSVASLQRVDELKANLQLKYNII